MNKAVFLDRDGVITQEPPHYAYKIEQLALVPGAAAAIRSLNEAGYRVVVVSNQAGIARGYYGEADTTAFNRAMASELAREGGARIDAIYICPHHPDGTIPEYSIACDCRKPKPALLFRARDDLDINLENSFMIGDKMSDIGAGRNAGCHTILVKTGYGRETAANQDASPNHVAEDLADAVAFILHTLPK